MTGVQTCALPISTGARLAGAGQKGKSSLQQSIRARQDPFVNRELSLLAFNERVLAQAEDTKVPLLERLRYLTIVSNNLDEFFEIRVAELKQLAESPSASLEILQTLAAVQLRARALVRRQYGLLNRELLPRLRGQGVVIHLSEEWNPSQREWAEQFFHSEVEPLLTPIALDPVQIGRAHV